MKRAWSVILAIVFVAILLGAIAIGVGCLTGADIEQVYNSLAESRLAEFIDSAKDYWTLFYDWAQAFLADLPTRLQNLF